MEYFQLNQAFCSHLEYAICRAFLSTERNDWRGIWCDGVLTDACKIFDDKSNLLIVRTQSWLGKSGQDTYQMCLYFLNEISEIELTSENLTLRVPEMPAENWINIDTEKQTIELFLNIEE